MEYNIILKVFSQFIVRRLRPLIEILFGVDYVAVHFFQA